MNEKFSGQDWFKAPQVQRTGRFLVSEQVEEAETAEAA
jgi:hypothetical protein